MSREDVLRIFKGSPERYEHLKRRVLELENAPKKAISTEELRAAQENLNKRVRSKTYKATMAMKPQTAAKKRWVKAKDMLLNQMAEVPRGPSLKNLFGSSQSKIEIDGGNIARGCDRASRA